MDRTVAGELTDDLTEVLIVDLGLAPERLRPGATLRDAGLDSLVLAELHSLLADMGIEVGVVELAGAARLADLDALLGPVLADDQPAAGAGSQ